MAEQSMQPTTADRRSVLRATALGVAAAGVGATAAACSTQNSVPQGSNAQTAQAVAPSGPVTVATTSQVPVDGGYISSKYNVVVTQPAAGEYKAFTATCTHQGCTVGTVANNVIQCPCHNSQFSAKDGSVVNGPASQPLAAKTINVSGGNIVLEG
jgi:Rieske Fe-S protein